MIQSFDDRRDIVVPGDLTQTIQFCVDQFIELANKSIATKNRFSVALSGGSTPKPIYAALASPPYASQVDWSKVWLFWSDERAVPPDHPDSNYFMSMEAGFHSLPIPSSQIFRMPAENMVRRHALAYERLIQ